MAPRATKYRHCWGKGLLEWKAPAGDGKPDGLRGEYGEAHSPEWLTNGGYWLSHI